MFIGHFARHIAQGLIPILIMSVHRTGPVMGRLRRTVLIVVPAIALAMKPTTALTQSAPTAEAQEANTPPTPALTWDDIVLQVDQHPLVGRSRHELEAARAQIVLAGAIPNPSLGTTLGRARAPGTPSFGTGDTEWGVELTLPLEWMATHRLDLEATEAGLAQATLAAAAVRLEVLRELRLLFWTLAYDQTLVRTLEDLQVQVNELVRLVRLRVESGEARPIESTRIEIELEMLQIELGSARAQMRTHQAQLALWFGQQNLRTTWAVDADLSEIPLIPDDSQKLLERLTQEHPLVNAGRARIQALDAQWQAEKRKRLPSFGVSAAYDSEADKQSLAGTLEVNIPLWNWNSGGVAQAQAARSAEKSQLEATLRELSAAMLEAYNRCLQDRETVLRYRQEILPRAEYAASTLEKTFQVGEAHLIDVLDARRVLLDAKRSYLSAELELQLDFTALATLTGEIDHE